jgi:hypothetical protein
VAATLVKDQAHDADLLALFVQVDGTLTDAAQVQAQVMNVSAGQPGTKLFPAATDWEDLTTTGRRSLGVYDVIDGADTWTPTAEYARGQVNWRYKVVASDPWSYVRRVFEVLDDDDTGGQQLPTLFLVQDMRDAGVPDTIADDAAAVATAQRMRELAERYCRQRFRPVWEVRRLRGYSHPVIPLPEPLYGLQSIVEGSTDLDLDRMVVWGHSGDGRRNPRVEIDVSTGSIMLPIPTGLSFSTGLITTITGVWGFFEPGTYEAPLLVKRALIDEAAWDWGIIPGGGGGGSAGSKKRERTDGHEIEWAVQSAAVRPGGLSLMGQATRDTLLMYRAPLALATQRSQWIT